MSGLAADRWRAALGDWAIPERILELAPVPPWGLPPELFRVQDPSAVEDSPSRRAALAGLAGGGTVLDVGCGGGAASLQVAQAASWVTGVDEQAGMLANFAQACAAAGLGHTEIEGRWPDAAGQVELADVVLCHHVVYNVAEIVPFLQALTEHARRLVVVELTAAHPTSPFNPLWEQFWGLSRPSEPSAQLFVEVVREMDYDPVAQPFIRPPRPPSVDRSEYVAFARRRLCLPSDRDAEIDAALGQSWPLLVPEVVAVAWAPRGAPSARSQLGEGSG